MTPSSVKKKLVLVGATSDETCASDGPITLTVSETKTDKETVTVTGSVSTTVGGELQLGIKDKVGFKGSMSGATTDSNSYSFGSDYAHLVTDTRQLQFCKKWKAYLNAFVSKSEGNFSKSGRVVAGWYGACGCYDVKCNETTGTGYGLGWGVVVHFRGRTIPCTCPQVTACESPGGAGNP